MIEKDDRDTVGRNELESALTGIADSLGPQAKIPEDAQQVIVTGIINAVRDLAAMNDCDPLEHVDDISFEKLIVGHISSEISRAVLHTIIVRNAYTLYDAAKLTGRSPEWVEKQRIDRHILGVGTGTDFVYPRFQFDSTGKDGLVQGVGAVCQRLELSPAACVVWMTHEQPSLGGQSPIDLLKEGKVDLVLQAAEDAARGV